MELEALTVEGVGNEADFPYQENDPGLEPHKRTGCLYGIVCKEDTHANRFFFFIDEKERQMFIDNFHSYIIDVNPFKTEIAA